MLKNYHENHYLEIVVIEIQDEEIPAQCEKWTKIAMTRMKGESLLFFYIVCQLHEVRYIQVILVKTIMNNGLYETKLFTV